MARQIGLSGTRQCAPGLIAHYLGALFLNIGGPCDSSISCVASSLAPLAARADLPLIPPTIEQEINPNTDD